MYHHVFQRQIQALKDLCNQAGVRHNEIEACTPKRKSRCKSLTITKHADSLCCSLPLSPVLISQHICKYMYHIPTQMYFI